MLGPRINLESYLLLPVYLHEQQSERSTFEIAAMGSAFLPFFSRPRPWLISSSLCLWWYVAIQLLKSPWPVFETRHRIAEPST
jgi:hypothetical protein